MDIFGKIAEEKIKEALEKGEFNNLSGAGKPICLDDDAWVPEDKKMCYKVLKNAGCVPPEVELKKEIGSLRLLINGLEDGQEKARKLKELDYKLMKFSVM